METSVSCVSYVSTFLQRIMDKSSVKETFDLLSLVEKDTTLRKSGAYHIGPCPFCGGCDRFTLKNTPDGWLWHCRKCGSDKYQDAIAYVMKHDNLTFTEALRSMGGETVAKQDRTRADKHKAKPNRVMKNSHFAKNGMPSRYEIGAGFRRFTPFPSPC